MCFSVFEYTIYWVFRAEELTQVRSSCCMNEEIDQQGDRHSISSYRQGHPSNLPSHEYPKIEGVEIAKDLCRRERSNEIYLKGCFLDFLDESDT
jgi:hypothetical protein